MNHPHSLLLSQHYFPHAYAAIQGGTSFPAISGAANFYQNPNIPGLLIEIELKNLPTFSENCPHFLGFHLHETGDCRDDFSHTGMHYNPAKTEHPCHAGDFPSLLNNNGYAYLAFYDHFFDLEDVIGRSVVIHEQRDNFTSQPAGDSGSKIACGIIRRF